MKTTLSFLILLLLSSTTCGYGSIAISQPSIDEMAEKADLAFIGRVKHITLMETKTIYLFDVHEYIKDSRDNITFKIQLSGGLRSVSSPPSPTFEHGELYLVFIVDDVRYKVLYGSYGKLLLDAVNSDSLDVIRDTYGSTPVPLVETLPISKERAQELAVEAFYGLLIDAYDVEVYRIRKSSIQYPEGSDNEVEVWYVAVDGKGTEIGSGDLVTQITGFNVVIETGEVITGMTVGSGLTDIHEEALADYPITVYQLGAGVTLMALFTFILYSKIRTLRVIKD